MKHKLAIILVLLGMFLVTQFIGLYVVNHYSQNELPYGMEPPEEINPVNAFPSIIIAFIIAIALFFLLTKFKIEFILKLWFLIVIVLALGLSINSFLPKEQYIPLMSLIIALPFALIKVFNRNIIVHNTTELLIYPGIAAVFVPLLNIWTMIILLIPFASRATRCSFVCGLGHGSFAAITRTAASIIAAPESIVAISISCPGASTKLMYLTGSVLELHFGQTSLIVYSEHDLHFLISTLAYPNLIVIPLFNSSE